jgi:hypothetical protein
VSDFFRCLVNGIERPSVIVFHVVSSVSCRFGFDTPKAFVPAKVPKNVSLIYYFCHYLFRTVPTEVSLQRKRVGAISTLRGKERNVQVVLTATEDVWSQRICVTVSHLFTLRFQFKISQKKKIRSNSINATANHHHKPMRKGEGNFGI